MQGVWGICVGEKIYKDKIEETEKLHQQGTTLSTKLPQASGSLAHINPTAPDAMRSVNVPISMGGKQGWERGGGLAKGSHSL